jgi:hypothetical protein
MVVYGGGGGVWWWCMVVYGGVWWCMVVVLVGSGSASSAFIAGRPQRRGPRKKNPRRKESFVSDNDGEDDSRLGKKARGSAGNASITSKKDSVSRNPVPVQSLASVGHVINAATAGDLHVGMKIEPSGETPKTEVFDWFRSNGHIPFLRNSRRGYIIVDCVRVGCDAHCAISANQSQPGWYITICTAEVLQSTCTEAVLQVHKVQGQGMVVYDGV